MLGRGRHKNRLKVAGVGASAAFLVFVVGMLDLSTMTAATGLTTAAMSIPYINPPPTKSKGQYSATGITVK